MENAIAAVKTGNISKRGAAKRFGVDRMTLSRKLKTTGNMDQMSHDTTQPELKSAKPKAADRAERDQWFADHQAGLSARKIAEKFGRSRLSITKEIKRREEPTPIPTPTPTPIPTPTEADSTREQILRDWNGQLGEHHEKIIRREKPRNRKTEKFLEAMGLIKSQLKQTMDAASKDTREHGAGFLRMYMVVVEEQLRRENVPQIKPSLEALRKEARDIWKYADESLRLLQLQEGCSELK